MSSKLKAATRKHRKKIISIFIFTLALICNCNSQSQSRSQSQNSHQQKFWYQGVGVNASTPSVRSYFSDLKSNQNSYQKNHNKTIKNSGFYNSWSHLDKLFGVDPAVFEHYLKDQDLSVIPGFRADEDLDNWTPSFELRRDFPTYIAGFDYYDRPIWVLEWGRWRFDKYITLERKRHALFEKYLRYLTYNSIKSQALKNTQENPVTSHVTLFDLDGLRPEFLTNRRIIQLQMKVISNYRRHFEQYVAKTVWINVNPVSEVLLNLARPFFIRIIDKFEVYGTSKIFWAPQLLRTFPKNQLPEKYGGDKGFRPLYSVG